MQPCFYPASPLSFHFCPPSLGTPFIPLLIGFSQHCCKATKRLSVGYLWHDALLSTNDGAMETEKPQEKNISCHHFRVNAQWLPDNGWTLELLSQLPNPIRWRGYWKYNVSSYSSFLSSSEAWAFMELLFSSWQGKDFRGTMTLVPLPAYTERLRNHEKTDLSAFWMSWPCLAIRMEKDFYINTEYFGRRGRLWMKLAPSTSSPFSLLK